MSQTGHDRVGMEADDDAAVIEHSARDPERFGVIFDRHAPYIHRYLARRLGVEVAEDLLAETFLVAFRKRDRYDLDQRNARPWLYGIATNLIGQYRRDEVRQFRLRRAVLADSDEACHDDHVVAVVTAQAARQTLIAALAELSPRDRDVLLLIAWEELTYDEVAAALGIPVGTVRSRLNRARRRARKALSGSDPTTFKEGQSDG